MKKLLIAVALSTAAIGAGVVAAAPPAEAWQIGPVIRGKNYSVGMPATMQPARAGSTFSFPSRADGSVHYVSLRTGPLEGAQEITVKYRIDAAPGTRFVAQENGTQGKFGLAFHRRGDNWSAKGRYEAYRWYSSDFVPLTPGVHTFTARFDDPRWSGVMSSTSASNPRAFAQALADTDMVSMTFGGDSGRGHGVYATGPARFTLLDFSID